MKSVTVVALVAVLSCKARDEAKPPPPKPPVDGIEVVNPGIEPRQLLRYRLAKGTLTTVEIATDGDVTIPGRDTRVPTLAMTVEIGVDDVGADGRARVRTKVVAASARERAGATVPIAQMAQMTPAFVGITMTGTLSPDGRLSGSALTPPGQASPALAAQLESLGDSFAQVAMALPDVPVGRGAIWRNRQTVTRAGIPAVTTTIVELTALDGDRVTFSTATAVSGADQTVTEPGAAAGAPGGGRSVRVTGVGGSGSSRGTLDLARMVLTGEIRLEFHAQLDGQPVKMASTTRITSGS